MPNVIVQLIQDLEGLDYEEQVAYLAHVTEQGLEAGFSPMYVSLCSQLHHNGWEDSENPAMREENH